MTSDSDKSQDEEKDYFTIEEAAIYWNCDIELVKTHVYKSKKIRLAARIEETTLQGLYEYDEYRNGPALLSMLRDHIENNLDINQEVKLTNEVQTSRTVPVENFILFSDTVHRQPVPNFIYQDYSESPDYIGLVSTFDGCIYFLVSKYKSKSDSVVLTAIPPNFFQYITRDEFERYEDECEDECDKLLRAQFRQTLMSMDTEFDPGFYLASERSMKMKVIDNEIVALQEVDLSIPGLEYRDQKIQLLKDKRKSLKVWLCTGNDMAKSDATENLNTEPLIPQNNSSQPVSIFHSMESLRFNEISIKVDPENLMLRLCARGKQAAVPLASLGLMKKNLHHLNVQGEALLEMADGSFDAVSKANEKRLDRLSRSLRDYFKIDEPPFVKGTPRFELIVPKNERAKFMAHRNTSRYNDSLVLPDNQNADDFLKDNDPDFGTNRANYTEEPE
jgi:hypothetical protein